MTLGTQPQQGGNLMPRRGFIDSIRGLAAAVVLMLSAMVFLAGCGGGSSSNPGPGQGEDTTATVTGRFVDRNAQNAGIGGLTVTYGAGASNEASTVTNSDGTFSLSVRNANSASVIRLSDAAGAFYDSAASQGATYAIKSSGIVVPQISNGETYSVGEIGLFSNSGPPPPPVFP